MAEVIFDRDFSAFVAEVLRCDLKRLFVEDLDDLVAFAIAEVAVELLRPRQLFERAFVLVIDPLGVVVAVAMIRERTDTTEKNDKRTL